ncbi:hypothetical protein B0E45_07740 [Sinorhizobium sp. A49]|nr:hypothetical protein B0E45_07740 [Sinorhizobium sp. A49]
MLLAQIKAVEAERDALIAHETPETLAGATALLGIRGIGPEFATILYTEGLFRHFDNRRQIASYAGLAPSPWQSGNVNREQGVSRAGNPRLRATMVELALTDPGGRTGNPFGSQTPILSLVPFS